MEAKQEIIYAKLKRFQSSTIYKEWPKPFIVEFGKHKNRNKVIVYCAVCGKQGSIHFNNRQQVLLSNLASHFRNEHNRTLQLINDCGKLDQKTCKHFIAKLFYKVSNEQVFENKLQLENKLQWKVPKHRAKNILGLTSFRDATMGFEPIDIHLNMKSIDRDLKRLFQVIVHEQLHEAELRISRVYDEAQHGAKWKFWRDLAEGQLGIEIPENFS